MVKFKEGTSADIALIRSIADVAFRDTYADILSSEQMEWMMEWMYSEKSLQKQFDDGQKFFIIYSDDVPCGYISIERQDKELFHLQKIYLLPAYQGKGLGRLLIEKGLAYIRSLNLPHALVELNVNRNNKAVGFYKAMGFTIARSGDFAIGEGFYMNDYIMSVSL